MLDLLLPQTPLRALRLCEIIFFVSRRGAEAAENFDVYFVLTPTWRELIVFFSRRGAENAEV
jgi:hypothetical protein